MSWQQKLGLTFLLLSMWIVLISFLGPDSSMTASPSILLFLVGGIMFNLGWK